MRSRRRFNGNQRSLYQDLAIPLAPLADARSALTSFVYTDLLLARLANLEHRHTGRWRSSVPLRHGHHRSSKPEAATSGRGVVIEQGDRHPHRRYGVTRPRVLAMDAQVVASLKAIEAGAGQLSSVVSAQARRRAAQRAGHRSRYFGEVKNSVKGAASHSAPERGQVIRPWRCHSSGGELPTARSRTSSCLLRFRSGIRCEPGAR